MYFYPLLFLLTILQLTKDYSPANSTMFKKMKVIFLPFLPYNSGPETFFPHKNMNSSPLLLYSYPPDSTLEKIYLQQSDDKIQYLKSGIFLH